MRQRYSASEYTGRRHAIANSHPASLRPHMCKRPLDSEDDGDDPSDNDYDDNDATLAIKGSLEAVTNKNFDLRNLLTMEMEQELDLRPFYQRGYKWKQKQASLWIESVLRGYPCPEIILIRTDNGYAVFDGQQRLTSMKLFVKGLRADSWHATSQQRKSKTEHTFALEGLSLFPELEGKTFKDLERQQQQCIVRDYDIRCAVIPASWPISDIIGFFRRIQGGGTRMSDQELRRAIARGAFTDLLDSFASQAGLSETSPFILLQRTLKRLESDELQELYLRFFTLQTVNPSQFGVPSIQQQGLETMKTLNNELKSKDGTRRVERLVIKLEAAITVGLHVFPEHTLFRRPAHLKQDQQYVWKSGKHINRAVWDCILYALALPERKTELIQQSTMLYDALVDVMQTSPSFMNMNKSGTSSRIAELERAVRSVLQRPSQDKPVTMQHRRELIERARSMNLPCAICGMPLPLFDELIHVDHIHCRNDGGPSKNDNLDVVHKFCNLQKGTRVQDCFIR